MSELHEFPYTNYSTPACDCGDFFGMCRRAGVKLAVVGDSLQLLDKCNFVLSQVKIAIARSALKDELGNDITAYIIDAGTRGDTVVFTKGNGDEIIVEVPAATKATTDAEGQNITSYLRNLVVSGNKLRVTKGDGVSYEITCPFATVAETDINSKLITSYGAAIAVSGNDIILKDGLGNTISTITCHWSERAVADELGNNIRESYGSDLVAGTTTIKLVSKVGDVLDEITVPYSTSAHQSDSGSVFTHDFGASLVIDPLDNKSLDLLAEDGTLLNKVLVQFSTLSLDATNAIESVAISGNDIVFTTYSGVVTRIQSPYSVKSLNDGANNEITKTYVADVRQDSVTGEITFYDAEGTAICSLVPNSAHAIYDDMDNTIHDYIKDVIFDTQNDYFLFTKGSGDTLSVVCGYSEKSYKDLRNNAIHDTYIAFVTNVVDGNGDWVMCFYNGEGSEKFRLKVVANKAQKDAAGNVITEFYVHSLTINGDTISYNDANGTAIGSITLPKYVSGMGWEYPSESFWYRLYDLDGNTLQRIKFPIQDWLRLGLVNTDQIQLQDFDNEELNIGKCTVHLPEYYYDAAISGTDLLLKDIHGNTKTTLTLPGSSDTAEYDLGEDTLFKIRQGSASNCYYASASDVEKYIQAIIPVVHNYKDVNGYIRARAIYAIPALQTLSIYKDYSVSSNVTVASGEISMVSYNITPTKDLYPFRYLKATRIGSKDYYGYIPFPASVGNDTIYPTTLPSIWLNKSNPSTHNLISIERAGVALVGPGSLAAGDTIECHKDVPLLSGLLDIQLYNDIECQYVIHGQNVQYTEDPNHNMFIRGIVNATRVTVSALNDTTGAVIRSRTTNINGGGFILQVQAKASGESEMVQLEFMNDNAPSNIQNKMRVTCYLQMPSGYTAKTS